jgi:hypothetical protein
VIVCEYFFKEFYSRGSDEYLNAWAGEIDRMGCEGWKVVDSTRRSQCPGTWTVVLVRPASEFCDRETKSNRSSDAAGNSEGWEFQ